MLHSALGFRGSFSAPHRAAALAGRDVLEAGGTAIEAMVAAAAVIAVVYPHMNGIGGDGFWLIRKKGERPIGISACGRAAALASPDWYAAKGITGSLPSRGGAAALTVPGTLKGWEKALGMVADRMVMPLGDLVGPAIAHARDGFPVSGNQARCMAEKGAALVDVPGFAEVFLDAAKLPPAGFRLRQPALANTLEAIARDGIDTFYHGDIAAENARFLEAHGSPLRLADFTTMAADIVEPLSVAISRGRLYNMPPPTQGVSSLMILALFDRLNIDRGEGFDHLHALVEATKLALRKRNQALGDPDFMTEPAETWLEDAFLDGLANQIDSQRAMPWREPARAGDTIWMGAIDSQGTLVSFIQSIFWEFGSALTCPITGVVFQNRGSAFSLQPGPNQLAPGKRPFHTLNPALAELADGRVIAYGTMGGEGQPQIQAALFTRYAFFNEDLQQAITLPRWLLGKTWGDGNASLKIEDRFEPGLAALLRSAGHNVEVIDDFSDSMGHAGAVVLHPDGLMEAAADPRADGVGLAY